MSSLSIFDLGADLYAAYTDNPAWRASCASLAACLPDGCRRALDLGCGPGTTIAALAGERPEVAWVGGDLAGRMLRLARRRLDPLEIMAAYTRLDAARLPFASSSFDAVVGHSFLYLVSDPLAVLKEARRVLRPGGGAAFMEPAAAYVSPRGIWRVSHDPRFLVSIPPWRVMSRRHRRFSPAAFDMLWRSSGFHPRPCLNALGGLGIIGCATVP